MHTLYPSRVPYRKNTGYNQHTWSNTIPFLMVSGPDAAARWKTVSQVRQGELGPFKEREKENMGLQVVHKKQGGSTGTRAVPPMEYSASHGKPDKNRTDGFIT